MDARLDQIVLEISQTIGISATGAYLLIGVALLILLYLITERF
jgi:hypothetical protein